jgi:ADP-ribose pyrophosphatase YjhB (NUDIX family)
MFKSIAKFLVQNYFRLKRPMTLGVRIVAINPENQICLVKHTYTAGWHLPGGGVEKGETTLCAAIKEAREEAGLIIAPENMKLVSIHANFANFKGDHVLVYHTKHWEAEETNRAHEIAECRFFAIDELPQDTTKGTLCRIKEALGQDKISTNW